VVPLDSANREVNIYSNILLGKGFPHFGNLTLTVRSGREGVTCEVWGIPERGKVLSLLYRDCTENPYETFSLLESLPLTGEEGVSKLLVNLPPERVYEFFTTCTYHNPRSGREEYLTSNPVMFRNVGISYGDSISVEISPSTTDGRGTTFSLTTFVTPTENERITTFLKEQVPELYEQYLSPANNTSSPLGGGKGGIPTYSDLFFHEVIRTNLNTGEREVFNLVGDGIFSDSPKTRTLSHVRDPDPAHEYIYQVFTYRKNPLELFKRFVSHGKDPNGKDWFYLPYKWRNGKSERGILYPDDRDGVPVIETWENFTSQSYGETGRVRVNPTTQYTTPRNLRVVRTDRRTVKISWELGKESPLYESFVVMKVVNGVRSILGRTGGDHIYHDLTPNDLGNLYYIIVPFMVEWDLGTPLYTDPLTITGEGIVEYTPFPGGV
jgi:hypothetical protein